MAVDVSTMWLLCLCHPISNHGKHTNNSAVFPQIKAGSQIE